MGSFSGPVDLEALNDGDRWRTLDPITYLPDSGEKITVPTGFVTDLASVPRIFWNILPPFGRYDGAAIIHDYLYSIQDRARAACDAILREAMKAEGVSSLTSWVIYSGVRIGGWVAWNGHKKALG